MNIRLQSVIVHLRPMISPVQIRHLLHSTRKRRLMPKASTFEAVSKGGRKKAPYDKKRDWPGRLQSGKRALQKAKLLEQGGVDVALGILVLFVGVASELRMFSSGNPLDCHQKCL